MTDDWTPEKEEEDDPIKIQRQQLELLKKFMAKLEAEEAEKKAQRAAHEAVVKAEPYRRAQVYTPPTFEEVSAIIKKAWDEVDRIMPKAPDAARSHAFQVLINAAAPPMGIGSYIT